jgi:hypothetical protein
MGWFIFVTGALVALPSYAAAKQLPCNSNNLHPQYFGSKVTSLTAKEVRGYAEWSWVDHVNIPSDGKPLNFGNATVTYTHPGQGDTINVYIWLPLEHWNGNFLGQGGGGWAAGSEGFLAPAVGTGYAAANTGTGHTSMGDFVEAATNARSWALSSKGNVNWVLLQDHPSVALDDMPNLAKEVIKSFYGSVPKNSYWNGCSAGGRQGMKSAQRCVESNGLHAASNLLLAFVDSNVGLEANFMVTLAPHLDIPKTTTASW